MASVVMSRTVLTKASPAGTAEAKAHYIAREASQGPGVRKVDYLGQTTLHEVRNDLVHAETRNMPSWAPDAAAFFRVAEAQERALGVVLTEYKMSMPRGLDTGQQLEFTRDFVDLHLSHNPVSWALHEPPGLGETPSPHVHMIFSARELDGIARAAATFFKRYNAKHPERGGARKSPALNQWNAPAREKQLYADLANVHMERAGVDVRYHPGSLASRGLQLEPEPKLLPSDSWQYHSRGHITEGMQTLLDHRAKMQPHRAEEALDAQQYWDGRKQALGLQPGMTHAQALRQIARGRDVAITHAPATRDLAQEGAQSKAHIRALDVHLGQIHDAQEKERSFTTPAPAPKRSVLERLFTYPPEPVPLPKPDARHLAQVQRLCAIDVAQLGTPPQGQAREPVAQTITERAAATRERTPARSLAEELAALQQRLEESPAGSALRIRLYEEHDQGIGF